MPEASPRGGVGLRVKTNLRVIILLWRQFRLSLTLFFAIIGLGSLLLWFAYAYPDTGRHLSFPESLHAVFTMLFFEFVVPFPRGPVQILFFVVPFLGLSVVVEGLVRFSLLLLDRRKLSGEWTVALISTYSGHIVVCGLGHVGYRVVLQLLEYGQDVVGLDKDPQAPFLKRVQQAGVPIILGDATEEETLRKVGVERAEAMVVATNDEMMNLEILLNVREMNPDIRVVLRMFDADLARKVGEVFGIRTAFSASAIAAPAFATAAVREGVTHSFVLEGELLHVSEVIVRSEGQLTGRTVQELEDELDISVIFHQRDERRDMHPDAALSLETGDKVVVFASLEQLGQLERLNCPPRRRGRARFG